MNIKQNLLISAKLILIGIFIFSIIYHIFVGAIGLVWNNSAKGSLLTKNNDIVGSKLIGQEFTSNHYFHSRPSSLHYEAIQSASANLAPNNPKLKERVRQNLSRLSKTRHSSLDVPADLVTESGSALDPHITPEAAYFQVPRIADETDLKEQKLRKIIERNIEDELLGLYGQKRVNVLKLNLQIEEVLTNE